MSDSLQPHGLQHARLSCPSPTPRDCLYSCPSSWWGHPTISSSLPTFNLSQYQGLFKWISSSHQVAKAWSFSFSTNPFNEYSGLISFRIDWLDLLVVQGTLKSLLQHHSSKASFVQCSAFFYGPTLIFLHDYWKTHSFDDMDLCWQNDDSAF